MPKLRGPLLSLNARGRLGKLFALARRRGQNIIERRPIPVDAKSPAQLFSRHMFNKCVALWHLLSEAERQEWESLASSRHMTGYAWFVSQCLRPNPGIYLPLQGGTMTGDIDMGKNRLLKLPEPTDDQEPATKGYVNALTKVIWKDVSQTGVSAGFRDTSLDWTDVDLTARTSPQAKLAIVRMEIRADTIGTANYSYIGIRKNGTTPTYYPRLQIDKAGCTAQVYIYELAIIGLDTDQLIEYKYSVGAGWVITVNVRVLGYIE